MPINPLVGAELIAGTGSLLGSLFGGISQNKSVKDTNKTNLQIANQNNATSMAIAQANNQLQREMNQYNNEWSRNTAIEMFNLENAYNTPAQQKARLIAAGLNPYALISDGAIGASAGDIATPSASSSGISPSMPTLTTPTMQAPPSVLGAMFGNLESVTRSLANLTQSGKTSVETEKIRTLLGEELKQAISDSKNKALETQINKFNYELDTIFKPLERNASLRKTINEATKLYEDAILAGLKQETEKADKLLKDADTILSASKNEQLQKQLPFISQQAQATLELTKEQKKTEQATQNMYGANADNARSSSRYTDTQNSVLNATYKDIVAIKRMTKEEMAQKLDKLPKMLDAELERLENVGLITFEQYEKLRQEVKLLDKQNATYVVDKIFGTIKSVVDIGVSSASFLEMLAK